jgi:cell division protease FtsH
VNLQDWATKTPGFSGADLQNLMNESAIYAARNNKSLISSIELENALEKARFGILSKPLSDQTKKRQIAYQIIGKTLVALLIPTQDKLEKISLFKSLGDISGMTYFTPDEETIDSGLLTRNYIYNKIVISLGSRAAEIIVFGTKEVTQGSQKDLENVYFWANQMVTKFGFSDLGPIAYDSEKDSVFLGKDIMKNRKEYSQKTSQEIDKQIISIANKAINHAITLLSDKVSLMDNLVDELIVKETLKSDYVIDSLKSFLSAD